MLGYVDPIKASISVNISISPLDYLLLLNGTHSFKRIPKLFSPYECIYSYVSTTPETENNGPEILCTPVDRKPRCISGLLLQNRPQMCIDVAGIHQSLESPSRQTPHFDLASQEGIFEDLADRHRFRCRVVRGRENKAKRHGIASIIAPSTIPYPEGEWNSLEEVSVKNIYTKRRCQLYLLMMDRRAAPPHRYLLYRS